MQEWGIVNVVVEHDKLLPTALTWARRICANSPDAVVVSRTGMLMSLERTINPSLANPPPPSQSCFVGLYHFPPLFEFVGDWHCSFGRYLEAWLMVDGSLERGTQLHNASREVKILENGENIAEGLLAFNEKRGPKWRSSKI